MSSEAGSLPKERELPGGWARLWRGAALAMSAYQLYTAYFGVPPAFFHRPAHLLFAFLVLFLLYPGARRHAGKVPLYDLVLIALVVLANGYLMVFSDALSMRIPYVTPLEPAEYLLGGALILLILEAARRSIGMVLTWVALFFLVYAYVGDFLPPPFWHKGYSVERIIEQLYLTVDGIWTIPLYVTSTYIFLFLLFGALLLETRAGDFFTDFSNALTGSMAGGPAKTAVLSSALMGTISGTSVTNVVTTGSFTIPTMRRTGYAPHFAGAVEAVASTGGQIMPPVMATAAFIMAEFTGISYFEITLHALFPAFLYFFAVYLCVHMEARKLGLVGLPRSELPSLWGVLRSRGYLLLSVAAIIYYLFLGYTPMMAAFYAVVTLVILVALFDREMRPRLLGAVKESLIAAPRLVVPVTTACAAAGIIIGIITMTGLGLRMTSIVIHVSGGMLPVALVLTMLIAVILGMGMPTSGVYIIMAVLLAPALVGMGVPLIAAHMFIFYFACLSAITPPVALASYAAAGIAGADPVRTGWTAFRLGLAAFIVPFMFVYGPSLLLVGTPLEVAISAVTATLGVVALAAGLQGWLFAPATKLERALLVAAALGLIKPGLLTDLAGLALLAGAYLSQCWRRGVLINPLSAKSLELAAGRRRAD